MVADLARLFVFEGLREFVEKDLARAGASRPWVQSRQTEAMRNEKSMCSMCNGQTGFDALSTQSNSSIPEPSDSMWIPERRVCG
jgi:hypothetical protein